MAIFFKFWKLNHIHPLKPLLNKLRLSPKTTEHTYRLCSKSTYSKCIFYSLQVSLHASLISLLWCHCFAAPSSQPIICGTWIDQEVGYTRFPALESVCMFYYGEFSLAHCDIFLTTDWLFPGYSYRCSIFHPDRVSSLAPANELLSELDSKMASCFWLSL